MRKQQITLGAIGLAAIVLIVAAFVAFSGGAPRANPTAAHAAVHSTDNGVLPPTTSTAPAPASPSPTASASPTPPPDPYMHVGAQGPDVQAVQQKLTSLTYMTGGVDGQFGGGTRDAIIAFQKVNGLKLTGEMDPPTTDKLASAGSPTPTYSTPGDHLEVDVGRQVVYVVRGGTVANTLTTSTGSGQKFTSQGVTQKAITPNGIFHVYWKIPGWHTAPLGDLYKPSFFNGGIAFHGYNPVPSYPASHGCIRLPMEFADWFYDQAAPMGSTVYVYGGPSGPNPDPAPVTTTTTNAPPPGINPSPTPTTSAPAGCLNVLLGLPCPTMTPSPTSSGTPTPTATSPTPTSTATTP